MILHMPNDVKDVCLEMYQKLYNWHCDELDKLELKLKDTSSPNERKSIITVQKRLVVERKRIRKIYPEESFRQDKFDALLGTPTK